MVLISIRMQSYNFFLIFANKSAQNNVFFKKITNLLQMCIFFCNFGTPLPCGRVPPKLQRSNVGHLGSCSPEEKYCWRNDFLVPQHLPLCKHKQALLH